MATPSFITKEGANLLNKIKNIKNKKEITTFAREHLDGDERLFYTIRGNMPKAGYSEGMNILQTKSIKNEHVEKLNELGITSPEALQKTTAFEEPKVFNPGIEQEYYKEKNAKKIANKNQEIANNNQKEFDNGQLESIGHNAQIIEKQRNEQRISEYNRKTKDKIRARREYLNAKRDLDNAEMPKKGDTSDSYDALRRTAGEKRKALRLVSKELSEDETYQKALAEAKAKRKEAPFERIYNKTYDHHYQRRIANGWSEEDAVKAATEEAELAKNNAKNSSLQKAAEVQAQANRTKPKAGGTPKTDQQSGGEVKKQISGSYNPIDSASFGGKRSWTKGYRKARQQYEDILANGTDEEKSKILGLINTEKFTPEQLADAKFMAKTIAKDQFKGGPSFGDYVAGNPKTLTAAGGVAIGFGAIATVNSNGGRRSNSSLYGSPF